MSDMDLDDVVEYPDESEGSSVAVEEVENTSEDNYAELQDRMNGEGENDEPWYSPSEGKVVSTDGEVILDPKTNKPYGSMEEYLKNNPKQDDTAKPKNQPEQSPAKREPGISSFNSLINADGDLTAEKILELSKACGEYSYNDELVLPIQESKDGDDKEIPTSPLQAVESEKEALSSHLVEPMKKVYNMLIENGAPKEWVDANILPIVTSQENLVKTHYEDAYKRAIREDIESPIKNELSQIKQKELAQKSQSNVDKLSQAYYKDGGKDAFFALINGHTEKGEDGKETFQRGPAVAVIDLLVSVANDGKTFKTDEARKEAYADTFKRITADPVKARALFDIAHTYFLGKNATKASKLGYEDGKKSATDNQRRIQRTIKTKPASYQAGVDDDQEGMPSMLKALINAGK